ncbi:DNA topoisomerase IB [Ktedonosporobacter rubrisoli]|uniref:DNA topoisomerase n=1 Tax=Ktedonosporobacter rubrisoli TaxID=2509675 RepID=A0A4P6JMW1_KTERU|nr:DNA topoisomerase IB [Ktedonosporobacter rubrisoli]QBD76584.1 DNA topoisomerase IB [Ktedonosporobacter rubrisoli]
MTASLKHHTQPVSEASQTCATADASEVAQEAGLLYVSDTAMPGITRKRVGKHFTYKDTHGRPIHDPTELKRIKSLGIPPAWTDVWICPYPQGHLQATGRDAKKRKQYRYHPHWRQVRDTTKYDSLIAFGETLPIIRKRISQDLALRGLPQAKVLATIVRLLDTTLIRVGNEEYARENASYGLTTLRNRHVDIDGSQVIFHFRGKSGKEHVIDVKDKQLARIVKRCQDLPGHVLFEYRDEDEQLRTVDSSDVNDYLRSISGQDFSAKDFRTWGGSIIAAHALKDLGGFENQTQAKKQIAEAIKTAASDLGNTPAICRKCYVHPAIIEGYLDGSLLPFLNERAKKVISKAPDELHDDEAIVLAFLKQAIHNEKA